MKIKNILTTVGVAGVLGSTILTGCGTKEETTLSDTNVEEETISYDAFSQTISEVINVNRNEINQLDGHLGYQPVAISLESYGKYFGNIDNGCIYFVNNQDIVSKVNQFGTPVSSNVEVEGGEFLPYQHILLVPSNEVDSNFEKILHTLIMMVIKLLVLTLLLMDSTLVIQTKLIFYTLTLKQSNVLIIL